MDEKPNYTVRRIGFVIILFVIVLAIVIPIKNAMKSDSERRERMDASMSGEPDFRVTSVELMRGVAENEYATEKNTMIWCYLFMAKS